MILHFNKVFIGFLFVFVSVRVQAQVTVSELKCDYQIDPIGIQSEKPQLSWLLQSAQRNVKQTAYRVIVSDNAAMLQSNTGNVWDSKKITSNESIQVIFSGKKLVSTKTYYWKVMVWDNQQQASAWSKPAKWQMGLLEETDWKGAKWIAYEKLPNAERIIPAIDNPGDKRWKEGTDILPLMRKSFTINKAIKTASAFITGLGQFDMSLNGTKVGDHFMDPGWTKYDQHALYLTFDITNQIKQGKNAVGVMLGNGFYYVPGERYHKLRAVFGYPKMICRILIQYQDGSEESIISNETWKAAPGPVTYSSIYGGEDYDANLEQTGWNNAVFNDQKWRKAVVVDGPPKLDAQAESPLKIMEQFKPVKISQPKPGVWLYDMGQNASAIPYIAVKGKKGAVIKITPAELLTDDGLANQKAVGEPVFFNYTLSGKGTEMWHPQFMYYGFRYIQVEGGVPANESNPNQQPVISEIKSLHTRNSTASIGTFSSSNDLFNKTFKLIDWAIRSNTVSVFTDCPHREKLGWLEEAHLVGSSIRYNYDIATLCRKVIRDMQHSQTADGLIPDIAPEYTVFGGPFRDSPEWGSNGILMPYYVYQWYGDKQILEESYSMMTRYANYLDSKSKNHILYFGLGDWYDIGPKDLGPSQLTPGGITSTAIFYYDLNILSRVAKLLGKDADAEKYTALAKTVRASFNDTFFHKDTKQYGSGSQAANAMSVYMGLVEPQNKPAVIENLIKDIRAHNNGVTAGDIGFRYLLRVLDDAGRSDVIFDMNSRSDVPGYGYQLARGATSLTESWQGNRISSNNHFMLGHLMEWFYSGLGGIKSDSNDVAFKHIVIRPELVGDVTYTNTSYQSPYGTISSNWKKTGSSTTFNVEIPANTTATIYLPATQKSTIKEAGKAITGNSDLKLIKFEDGKALIQTGSGKYNFSVE